MKGKKDMKKAIKWIAIAVVGVFLLGSLASLANFELDFSWLKPKEEEKQELELVTEPLVAEWVRLEATEFPSELLEELQGNSDYGDFTVFIAPAGSYVKIVTYHYDGYGFDRDSDPDYNPWNISGVSNYIVSSVKDMVTGVSRSEEENNRN